MSAAAVIGLGTMGSRIAARLLEKRHDVVVWNRTTAKSTDVIARGASPASIARLQSCSADAVYPSGSW